MVMAMFLPGQYLRLGKYLEQQNNNLDNSDNKLPYDITLLMTSLLCCCFSCTCNVDTLTQVKAIYSQPYFHMCISVSQPVGNIGIAEFAGIAVFAPL